MRTISINNKVYSSDNTIVINATNISYKYHGIGVYSLHILKELIQLNSNLQFIVYINRHSELHLKDIKFPENFHLRWISGIISPDNNFKGNMLRLIFANILSFKYRKFLLFNTSQNEINFFRRNQVVTIHDIIPLLFKEYHKKQYLFFKFVLKFGLKYVRFVLTPSNHSKVLLQQIFNLSNERIKVIHNGSIIEKSSQLIPELKTEKFILYIGRINKMKNIFSLLKAFSIIGTKVEHKLVIVGDDENMLKKEIKLAGLSPTLEKRIIFKSNLSEEEKCFLLHNASVFVFTSLYEGFGLPPLEAMGSGCPVIVSNNSSLPEVCGNAAYYINPRKPSEISKAIIDVLTNDSLRSELIIKGLERAVQFDWVASAREHLKVLEHVLSYSKFPKSEKQNALTPLQERKIKSIGLSGVNY